MNAAPHISPPFVASSCGLSSFALKILAIAGMTASHIFTIFEDSLPFGWACFLEAFGGMTFPIMAFLLVEGYRHTSNIRSYALRLFIFALASQIPYQLFLFPGGNVLFTLLLGLGLLYLYDHTSSPARFWLVFCLSTVASIILDWGFIGPIMIFLFYKATNEARKRAPAPRSFVPLAIKETLIPLSIPILALGIPYATSVISGNMSALPGMLYALVGCSLAAVLLLFYNGERGKPLKWVFYAYYPAHISLLGIIHLFFPFVSL